ncbi:hypothetical protein NQ314_011258 [Rhamnusium bicolor]|uniref:Uncharacterized protein n=1 Tax=Rhamnusium bicolor TaxID=1586634 RepID=A0AAV8XJP5_9CUCU|nr:hypothetical protein NQ314_011258 [Rhamnusium bicolor]
MTNGTISYYAVTVRLNGAKTKYYGKFQLDEKKKNIKMLKRIPVIVCATPKFSSREDSIGIRQLNYAFERSNEILCVVRFYVDIFSPILYCCEIVFGCIFAKNIMTIFKNIQVVDESLRKLNICISYSHVRRGKHYTPYRHYTKETLDRAVQAVKNGSTILVAADQFHVPKFTINRVLLKQNKYENPGRPPLFTVGEESHFAIFESLSGQKGVQERRLKNNTPGRDWVLNFLKRHKNELSNRLSSNISSKRASLSANVLDSFFANAQEMLTTTDPSLMVNFNENNLTDNPRNKKFIFKRGTRYPERVINSTKNAISLIIKQVPRNKHCIYLSTEQCDPRYATHCHLILRSIEKILEGCPHSLEKTKGREMSYLSKDVFPQLLNELQKKLDDNGKGSKNLISGFAKTGLYPFDLSRPKQKLPNKPKNIIADISSDEHNISLSSIDSDDLPLITIANKGNIPPANIKDPELLPIGQWVKIRQKIYVYVIIIITFVSLGMCAIFALFVTTHSFVYCYKSHLHNIFMVILTCYLPFIGNFVMEMQYFGYMYFLRLYYKQLNKCLENIANKDLLANDCDMRRKLTRIGVDRQRYGYCCSREVRSDEKVFQQLVM